MIWHVHDQKLLEVRVQINAAKKRETEDNLQKVGAWFAELNRGDNLKNASKKLVELYCPTNKGDISEWDECNFWVWVAKIIIKMRQNV
ncbi:hypothetical protein Nepgr_029094 [Nepenthes gracilis]|uniref:Uncharacterized protein n=1 Tax=Nepenthes gracilis TaxID=150966 RepID=A0AAD3TDJ3_NEPGR|nr:hypothetical protein Nepgr_029094 [Nepenthes gracilis]